LFEVLEAFEPQGFEVLGEWSECWSVGAIEVLPAPFCQEDEVCFTQDAKMLRYCPKCDVSIGGYFACW
jgi:hypothetical protein